jgi:DNA helicase II / ATP-dependent DNA helicase PcrA
VDTALSLNNAQRAAVEHPGGPLLVVAGAGSGKTRVLTARVAWLLERGVRPEAVLAFTFTNRAAREMRARLELPLGDAARALWVGTFHATAVRILRREARVLGLPSGFVIYDREDQEDVVREILKRLELPEDPFRPGAVLGKISDAKNALATPEDMARTASPPFGTRLADVYEEYQRVLRAAGALDFDDLIAESVRLLNDRPEIGARYARRFEHVLVDEYQDTNHAQFLLIRALASHHKNLFVVGDDDQSIYGWRGANLANVLEFETAFPGAHVVRLEQNYRSTANILRAANAVIENNRARKGKTLWCEREDGAKIRFVLAADEVDEARRVRAVLADHVKRGGALRDVAVLYRTNAQSRAIETELRQARMPYEIVGGVSFYQRREVKDLLAYLRLVVNPSDAVSFWRVWNTPRRGLGAAVRAQVEARVQETGTAPTEALRDLVERGALARAASAGASAFLDLLAELRARADEPVDVLFARLLERSDYLASLESDEDAADRKANVRELGVAAEAFAQSAVGGLEDFLAESALITDADRVDEAADRVLLLTAHNAKGLEFPVVVVAGLEEGLFPHASSLEDGAEIEEERRLFYVALTRARDRVVLTAAAYRRRFDGSRGGAVSRFVDEIPEDLLERELAPARPRREEGGWGGRSAAHPGWRGRAVPVEAGEPVERIAPASTRHRAVGRAVYHAQFGRGVVVAVEDAWGDAKFTVRFGTTVRKVLGRFLSGEGDGDGA